MISVDVDGNSGVVTFDSPITTFPALFHCYNPSYNHEGDGGRITEVTIPDKVTVIPPDCFYKSSMVVSVPSSLKEIGPGAFQYVEVIGSDEPSILDLRNATKIGQYAFYSGWWNIQTIYIDSSKLTAEDEYVFNFPDLHSIVDLAYDDATVYDIMCEPP